MNAGGQVSAEELAALPLLAGLDAEVLRWLAEQGQRLEFASGEMLYEQGAPADAMFVLLRGQLQFRLKVSGQLVPIAVQEPGSVTGLLPYSRMQHFTGRAVALTDTVLLRLGKEHFPELLQRSPELGQRLVSILSDRVRRATRVEEQRDKMIALGKLSAGLAHELNNPAAAVRSTVEELQQRLARLPELVARLVDRGLTGEQVRLAGALRGPGGTPRRLSSLERGECEDQLAQWLEDHGVAEGWRLAEALVEEGLGPGALEPLVAEVPAPALADLLVWMEGGLAARRLLADIAAASGRISELVAAVKGYSHMDQAADKQLTDITAGIDSTLVMLGHKLKGKAVRVVRRYAPDLPLVPAFPGELNQVWTNLIDNAVDAMSAGGELTIAARVEGDCLVVDVDDTGHGIPPQLQGRIFEPFFTTKDVGEGTGLGLEMVQRIVNQQHGGTVNVESVPGRTVFSVWLPLADEACPPPAS